MSRVVIQIGDVLYGFCHGMFGEAYGPNRVEAVGRDWIVARDEDGRVVTAVSESGDIHDALSDCLEPDSRDLRTPEAPMTEPRKSDTETMLSTRADGIMRSLVVRQGLSYAEAIRVAEMEAAELAAPYREVADYLRRELGRDR